MHDEEPIVSSNFPPKAWIYESPDNGKTVYKRLMGSSNKLDLSDEVENELKDKLGVDILKKVTKLIGE